MRGRGRSVVPFAFRDLASSPLFWAAICLTALLGLLTAYLPVYGDQALFLIGAIEIDRGAILYADFWDTKQPGIFWFYWLAGQLSGFRSEGIYLLALVWLLAAALLLTASCTIEFKNQYAISLVPLLSTGLFFWNADITSPAQIEILVSLPLAGCVLLGVVAHVHGRYHPLLYLSFGVCSALVAIFKLMLLAVPACIWCCLAWDEYHRRGRTLGWIGICMLIPTVAGGALPVAAAGLYFYRLGAWSEFRWTTFEYPRLAMSELAGKPLRSLLGSTTKYLLIILPALPLVAYLRKDLRRERLRLIELLATAWIVSGLAAILLQRLSWWGYHFALLLAPSGVLIASLLDRLAGAPSARTQAGSGVFLGRILTVACLVTIFGVSHANGIKMLSAVRAALAGHGAPIVERYRRSIDPRVTVQQAEAAFLNSRTDEADRIYVFGDPRILLWSARRSALAINGWSWETMLQSQWDDLPRQLAIAAPSYVSVSDYYLALISRRSPQTLELLNARYDLIDLNGKAIYRLRPR